MPEKKVDNDALCPINVIHKNWIYFNIDLKKVLFNLVPYFLPQSRKSRILEDLTEIYITGPTIAL